MECCLIWEVLSPFSKILIGVFSIFPFQWPLSIRSERSSGAWMGPAWFHMSISMTITVIAKMGAMNQVNVNMKAKLLVLEYIRFLLLWWMVNQFSISKLIATKIWHTNKHLSTKSWTNSEFLDKFSLGYYSWALMLVDVERRWHSSKWVHTLNDL